MVKAISPITVILFSILGCGRAVHLHHIVAAPFFPVLIKIRLAAIFTQHYWLEWPLDGSNF